MTTAGVSLVAGLLLASGCAVGGGQQDDGTATLTVVDAPVGLASDRETSTTPAVATFEPAAKGAPVVIQEKVGGAWKDVAQGRQDASGRFVGQVTTDEADSTRQFRARTQPRDGASAVTSRTVAHQPMKLVWSDEFEGDALDPRKWQTREQPPVGRRLCATPDQERVTVKGGSAVLSVKRVGEGKGCPDGVWRNAMIGTGEVTRPGFQTTYGVFAARIKFQRAQGMHGSFWLQGPGGNGAEIDVAEYFGDGRADGGLSNFVHYTSTTGEVASAGGTQSSAAKVLGDETPADGWHVYSVEWSPKGYVFRLDGHETFRTAKPFVATAQEFIVLSLLTSDYEIPRLKDPTSTMKVDWVRAWQQ